MIKKLQLVLIGAFLISLSQSCKKDNGLQKSNPAILTDDSSETSALQRSFAKILAKAVKNDPTIRAFLKEEALKQFDNDYDVLYQIVKDQKINGIETLHEKLVKYANSQNELETIESKLPLLTIFIPNLPNFSPEIWNTNTEIPLIASSVRNISQTYLYNYKGEEMILQPSEIPGSPVLVVKQNERVIADVKPLSQKSKSLNSINNESLVIPTNGVLTFSFADNVFNNINKKTNANKLSINRQAGVNDIDPVNITAYNSGVEWQRDNVYYGLTPTKTKGAFINKFSEFITSFKFLTPEALGIIADQDGDPKANNQYDPQGRWKINNQPLPKTMWTEGNFEISITVLFNSKNGLGTQVTKMMTARPDELFTLNYTAVRITVGGIPIGTSYYKLSSITPKEFHPNIELVPWDLENYGTGWKFIFYEVDNAQEITRTEENTTTYASNFEITNAVTEKVGLKFGGSTTNTQKATFSVKTTLNSDFLGEATLTFDQPIITGFSNGIYSTREITTGNYLSISVEPKRISN